MQSPAKPKGCRGYVTATKHIGLDSFRVRNCEPGANDRPSMNRASPSWNKDFESGCNRQPSGPCAPGRLFVTLHDTDRRPPFVSDVEILMGCPCEADAHVRKRGLNRRGSTHRQRFNRSSPFLKADSAQAAMARPVHLLRWDCASVRIASFFVLEKPFFSLSVPSGARLHDDVRLRGCHPRKRFFVAPTDSKSDWRTHSLLRVSYEKRNVDECPPTGGKSDCHR